MMPPIQSHSVILDSHVLSFSFVYFKAVFTSDDRPLLSRICRQARQLLSECPRRRFRSIFLIAQTNQFALARLCRQICYEFSLSCATYTIVSILSKRTERDFAGKILKAASINGSTKSIPSAFHRHRQHSINCFSAGSPPTAKIGSIPLIVSPSDRLSSASTAVFSNIELSPFSVDPGIQNRLFT